MSRSVIFNLLAAWGLALGVGAFVVAVAPGVPSTAPVAEASPLDASVTAATESVPAAIDYGKLVDGLRVGLVPDFGAGTQPATPAAGGPIGGGRPGPDFVPGGKFPMRLGLDNQHAAAADFKGAFVWVFVAAGKGVGYYTEAIPLGKYLKNGKLPGESTTQIAVDLADLEVYPYARDVALKDGYPAAQVKSSGRLTKLLPVGVVRMRCMVYLPATETLVQGNTVKVTLGEPTLSALDPAQRKALVDGLLAGFHGDPYAGDAAHKRALRLGPELLPDLLTAMDDPALSDAGKQWLAASVCDLGAGNADAVRKLTQWLNKGQAATVIAYYGPRVKSPALDAAILGVARKDAGVASWAARGYAGRNDAKVRADLTAQVLADGDAVARGNLAEGLVVHPGPDEIAALTKLLADTSAPVRIAAAKAIGKAKLDDHAVDAALIQVLKTGDDGSFAAASGALAAICGKPDAPTLDAAPDAARKVTIVEYYQRWLDTHR
jgi:hypothetical protein